MNYDGPERRQKDNLSFLECFTREELLEYALSRSVDQRTGLLTLDAFKDALSRQPTADFPATLLVLDIVGLKALNTAARYLGDKAISEAGRILRRSAEGQLSARMGGDEFGIYLPGTNRRVAQNLVDRIEEGVQQSNIDVRCEPQFARYALELRYGVVALPDVRAESIDDAIDTALHKAYQGVPVTPRS